MKYRNILLNICLLSLSSGFVACSSESGWGEPEPETPGKDEVANIEVKMADFDVNGDNDETRSTQSGNNVNFEVGDAIGITLYNGSAIAYDNVKVTYDGSKWVPSTNLTLSGKNYYAYYPYDPSCSGVKTDAALMNKLPVITDQTTKENYKKSDIMSATGTVEVSISINLKHIRSCVSIQSLSKVVYSPQWYWEDGKYDYICESETFSDYCSIELRDPANKTIYGKFYKAEDGTYRCIVAPGNSKGYNLYINPTGPGTGSITSPKSAKMNNGSTNYVAGKRYNHSISGLRRQYSWQDLKVGDLIYETASHVLQCTPGGVINLPAYSNMIATVCGIKATGNKREFYVRSVYGSRETISVSAGSTLQMGPYPYYCTDVSKVKAITGDRFAHTQTLINYGDCPSNAFDEHNDLTSRYPEFGKWSLVAPSDPITYNIKVEVPVFCSQDSFRGDDGKVHMRRWYWNGSDYYAKDIGTTSAMSWPQVYNVVTVTL